MLRVVVPLVLAVLAPAIGLSADDTPYRTALARAREAYNAGHYDTAIDGARETLAHEETADAARLIVGRALLEQYRSTGQAGDLGEAIEALRGVRAERLDRADQAEWLVGLGQWFFYTERFGAAAELFEQVTGRARLGGEDAGDRALDWWASALDRQAQRTPAARERIYRRMLDRMEDELASNPGSIAANYWIVASARGLGDVDRAWESALAGWLRAELTPARTSALRADLDRLVLTAIIPDRARGVSGSNQQKAADTMVTEWERFKQHWNDLALPDRR